jgi:t-SNARE complex subunit (syntaxin)
MIQDNRKSCQVNVQNTIIGKKKCVSHYRNTYNKEVVLLAIIIIIIIGTTIYSLFNNACCN